MGYIALLEKRELQRRKLRKAALKEAERLSALLKKEFEYRGLYLIGSVVRGKGFGRHSDIDFVIKGLKKELFLKPFALLMRNSMFAIDLKPWEELDANSKAKVEREGRSL